MSPRDAATIDANAAHIAAARAAKACRIADLLADALTAAGADSAPLIAGAGRTTDDAVIVALAESAGIRKPSPTTCEAVRRLLEIRAEQAGVPTFKGFDR